MTDDVFDDALEDDDGDDFDEDSGPKALRTAYKSARREIKELRAQLEAAGGPPADEDEAGKLIRERGLPGVIRELIGDNDPQEWFDKYGDAFSNQPGAPVRPQLTAEQRAQLQGVTDYTPGRSIPGNRDPLHAAGEAVGLDNVLAELGKAGLLAPKGSQVGEVGKP